MKILPKYGYCLACGEFFRWDKERYCPNDYHNIEWTRRLIPCYECWYEQQWGKPISRKLLMVRCKKCEHRFVCLTNGWIDAKNSETLGV